MIFVEDSPSLEAALPDQDADDETKEDDDDEEEDRSSLDDFGWVECTDYLSTKLKVAESITAQVASSRC